ncbi:hypothetical protein V1517DRAFT_254796 [Lipomyces orientalis]|uniref:Uncharacterized protein n=1 Tax=Lipomyces orientalis TaxID=1233043 RepID=A0ACC3TVR1_9ASCO
MAHSELLAAVRRPLSPDSQIEVHASRDEYELVQEMLEKEDAKYPRLQYDGRRKVVIIVAAPSPLHGQMVGLDANIKGRLSYSSEMSNTTYTGDSSTTRNWDGALRYRSSEGYILMVAVEVGMSQTYDRLRAAISYSVSDLHCRVGITMCIDEGHRGPRAPIQYYSTAQERDTAMQQAERQLRTELRNNRYGPLVLNGFTWYGMVKRVVVETFRLEEEDTLSPGTLLDPTQSFAIVEEGRFVGGDVPSNLAELKLEDCIPIHILSGNMIAATPLNFFSQEWFEESFGLSMLETALERIKNKSEVRQA